MRDEDLYNLSDEDLEAQFAAAKAEADSPEISTDVDSGAEEVVVNEEEIEEIDEVEDTDDDSEVAEEDLEQPEDEDSDDDLDTTDGNDGEDSDDSDTEEGDPDEEPETEEDQPAEETKVNDSDVSEVQKFKVKANGKDYEFSDKEIFEQFPKIFAQAMDYTKKTQAIKPWRKTIDAMESAKITHDDVNLFIDVLKGDKNAIGAVLKRTGVDALDLDTENSGAYKPNNYGRDEAELAVKDVIEEISSDREYYGTTERILSRDWDETSFKEMTKDPTLIKLLHADVRSGMYDTVQPVAEKLKVFDNGRQSDLDYYKQAAMQVFSERDDTRRKAEAAEQAKLDEQAKQARKAEIERVKAAQDRQKTVKKAAVKRKAAAPTKVAGAKKAVDYLDGSDESFEEWYNKLQDAY